MPDVATRSTTDCTYELTGPGGDAPLVVALGGISASRHVAGWWGDVVGDDRFVDTTRFQVLGLDWLDGGAGPDGRPARTVSTHDQADALVQALDACEIARIHTLIGASYGGMVAQAFADRYPERVEQLIVISAPAQPHPMSTAIRGIQRRIVELGLETGREFDSLVLARALAMTTYRSAAEFAERFDGRSFGSAPLRMTSHPEPFTAFRAGFASEGSAFPVEGYLRHRGETFARQFTPARFIALSLSSDLHRVDPSQIHTPALLVGAEGDTLVPREQMVDLAERWGGPCRLVHTTTHTGHDAFLAEPNVVGGIIRNALNSPVLL